MRTASQNLPFRVFALSRFRVLRSLRNALEAIADQVPLQTKDVRNQLAAAGILEGIDDPEAAVTDREIARGPVRERRPARQDTGDIAVPVRVNPGRGDQERAVRGDRGLEL